MRKKLPEIVVPDEAADELALALQIGRRNLCPQERKRYITILREKGKSVRQIAAETGLSKSSVARAVPSGTADAPAKVTGRDGKQHPASKRPWTPKKRSQTDDKANDAPRSETPAPAPAPGRPPSTADEEFAAKFPRWLADAVRYLETAEGPLRSSALAELKRAVERLEKAAP